MLSKEPSYELPVAVLRLWTRFGIVGVQRQLVAEVSCELVEDCILQLILLFLEIVHACASLVEEKRGGPPW